jgi:23S rRNA-/tRNA-specific pseudouridylate synthase
MKNLKKYIKKEIKSLIENKIVKRYDIPEEIKDALENQLEMYPLIRFISNLKAVNSIPPSYRVFLLNGNHFDIIYEDYSLMVKINKTEYYLADLDERNYAKKHINRLLVDPIMKTGDEEAEAAATDTPSPTPTPPSPPPTPTPTPEPEEPEA